MINVFCQDDYMIIWQDKSNLCWGIQAASLQDRQEKFVVVLVTYGTVMVVNLKW